MDQIDALNKLRKSPKLLDMKVCDVAGLSVTDPRTQALFTLACGEPFAFTHDHWRIVVNMLDNNCMSLRDYLRDYDVNHKRSDY